MPDVNQPTHATTKRLKHPAEMALVAQILPIVLIDLAIRHRPSLVWTVALTGTDLAATDIARIAQHRPSSASQRRPAASAS